MQQQPHRIALLTSGGHHFFSPDEIIRLEASSSYTRIYLSGNKKIVAAKVLKEFAKVLEPLGFLRTHRAHLVNRRHIARVTPQGQIIMKDASVADISKRMRSGVMKTLKNAA